MKLSLTRKIVLAVSAASATVATAANNTGSDNNSYGVIPSTINGEYTIGPNYTVDPAIEPCPDCERGKKFELYMPIEDTLYNCDPDDNPYLSGKCADGFCGQDSGRLGMRNITVYIPASYRDGEETGVMVKQDGESKPLVPNTKYSSGFDSISNVMDRFIGSDNEERSLPTFVLVSVELIVPASESILGNPCGSSPGSERLNEYQTVSGKYAQFVSNEVLPFVTNHKDIKSEYPNLKITNDPDGRATLGDSDGGAAAIKMAFYTPELFRIAIGYHAALINHDDENLTSKSEFPFDMGELWIPESDGGQELIKNEDLKPIRIFHAAADRDLGTPKACLIYPSLGFDISVPSNESATNSDLLEANNMTEEALVKKGYDTRYAHGLNACHSDINLFYQDMPNTLVWAWANWKKKQQKSIDSTEDSPGSPQSSGTAHIYTLFGGISSVVLMIVPFFLYSVA